MLELEGVLLVDKAQDMTSYDVIRKLKPFFPRKYKIGHAGTLDPFATGLLIVLLGRGTKLMNGFHELRKKYTFELQFGFETDTQDITGSIMRKSEKMISEAQLEDILSQYRGDYLQTPPIYSAKKVNGKKAYELARKGEEVELKPKNVFVHNLDLEHYAYPSAILSAVVSSGTYIRTLVVDIAHSLGTVATTKTLRRESIGAFSLQNALKFSMLSEEEIWNNFVTLERAKELIEKR